LRAITPNFEQQQQQQQQRRLQTTQWLHQKSLNIML
jgi:hypothetical protein